MSEKCLSLATRRQFIKSSGIVASSAPFVTSGLLANPPSERLRHASFGAGGMAGADIGSLARSKHFELVAVADVDLKRAEGIRKRFPKAKFYQDWRELLDKESKNIDSVNVSTPDHMHGPIGLAAMDLGKHCYGQKPLAHNLRECRAMTEMARENKLMTQMGIQISSAFTERLVVSLVQSGAIGKVTRVHSFSSKKWGDMGPVPQKEDKIPEGFDWDLWLGVAKHRPYIAGYYHPGNWRKRRDFGTGTFGDMGCHIFSGWYRSLGLTSPLSVVSHGPASNQNNWAINAKIDYVFPSTKYTQDGNVSVTWYDGNARPPKEVADLVNGKVPGQGSIIIGTDGVLLAPHMSTPTLYPAQKYQGFKYPKLEPRDHYMEYVDAARGASGKKPSANFDDYSGPLTETVLLGCLATLFPGEKLDWDTEKLKVTNNVKADIQVGRDYRNGWKPKAII
ncbi:MAG: Gfo/Idh/MocA family oxidoreductase [Verrucomicrobiota bacterium]|nr:Gfo/Idh/MocA family oxidoreductase [Verrucomicrobiota bacterium]